jgi:uncharacterized caspase-like protein
MRPVRRAEPGLSARLRQKVGFAWQLIVGQMYRDRADAITHANLTQEASVGSGLAPVQSAIGTMIAYATQPDNVALDGEGRNSPFTTALLKYIATPKLEIGSIMKRVRADVIATTREKQVPWDHSSLVGDVILVP